jgi:hypothetical protein
LRSAWRRSQRGLGSALLERAVAASARRHRVLSDVTLAERDPVEPLDGSFAPTSRGDSSNERFPTLGAS